MSGNPNNYCCQSRTNPECGCFQHSNEFAYGNACECNTDEMLGVGYNCKAGEIPYVTPMKDSWSYQAPLCAFKLPDGVTDPSRCPPPPPGSGPAFVYQDPTFGNVCVLACTTSDGGLKNNCPQWASLTENYTDPPRCDPEQPDQPQCPTGQVCDHQTLECEIPCDAQGNCPSGLVCNSTTSACEVPCEQGQGHCPDGYVCDRKKHTCNLIPPMTAQMQTCDSETGYGRGKDFSACYSQAASSVKARQLAYVSRGNIKNPLDPAGPIRPSCVPGGTNEEKRQECLDCISTNWGSKCKSAIGESCDLMNSAGINAKQQLNFCTYGLVGRP